MDNTDKLKVLQEQNDIDENLRAVGRLIKSVIDAQGQEFMVLSEACAYRKDLSTGGSICRKKHPESEFKKEVQASDYCHLKYCSFVNMKMM